MERAVFCMVRNRVTALRFRRVRFTFWRERLAADFVLAIADEVLAVGREMPHVRGYNRLFNASFAFCRSAASAPAIRICSAVIVPLLSLDPS